MTLGERGSREPTVREFLEILAREKKSFKVYHGRGWQLIKLVPR